MVLRDGTDVAISGLRLIDEEWFWWALPGVPGVAWTHPSDGAGDSIVLSKYLRRKDLFAEA